MKGLHVARWSVVIAVCFGMAMPVSVVQGSEVRRGGGRPAAELSDLVLDLAGRPTGRRGGRSWCTAARCEGCSRAAEARDWASSG